MQKKDNKIKKNFKLIIIFLAMMVLFFIPTKSNAAQTEQLDGVAATLSDSGILTISGSGELKRELVRKFDYKYKINKVVINSGITSIGNSTFSGCWNLTSIIIPEGVTSIGNDAFYNSALATITIPEGVTSIGNDAFSICWNLTSITIPGSVVENLEISGFETCDNLIKIEVDKNNSNYSSENGVLFNKDKTKIICYPGGKQENSYTIPSGVISIKEYAFEDCSNLTNIEIPSSVTSIEEYAFYGCRSLTSIKIPEGVTSIGDYAFCGCSNLTSIEIPEGVTSIGDAAFYNCISLTSITIPNGVTSIGDWTFYECESLTSITIPNSVTSIENDVFKYCNENLKIYCKSNSKAKEYAEENDLNYVIDDIAPILTVTGNTDNWVKDMTLTIKATDNESGINSVKVNGQTVTLDNKGEGTYKVTQNGTYEIISLDKVGNASDKKTIKVTKIDMTKPTLSVSGNPSDWTNKDVTLTIKPEDKESGVNSVTVNGTAVTLDSKGQATYKATKNGTYEIVVKDKLNNSIKKTVKVTKIDKTKPTVTVTGNPNSWTNGDVKLKIKVEDKESDIENLTVNGTKITLKNGEGTCRVTKNATCEIIAKDKVGNSSKQTVKVTKIDKTKPTVTVSGNPTSWAKEAILSIKAEDKQSGINSVKVNGTPITLTNGQASYRITQNGTYEIVATDNIGNTSDKQTIVVNKIIKSQSGDVNKDDKINIADVIAVIRHIGAKEGSKYYLNEKERYIADINQDGKINIADVIGIIRLISGNNKN